MRCMRCPPNRRRASPSPSCDAGCRRLGALLRRHGLGPGDTVSLVMPNGLQTLRILLGAMAQAADRQPGEPAVAARADALRARPLATASWSSSSPDWEAPVRALLSGTGPPGRADRRRPRRPAPARRGRSRVQRRRGAGQRRGAADVHLGHHRRAQGRDADAGQPGGQRALDQRRACADARRPRARRAAAVPHQRLRRDHAGAAGARRQRGRGAALLGRALLGAGRRHALHLDQRGADDHLLPARRRGAGCRGAGAHPLLPLGLGRAAAGAPAGLRAQVRHRHRRDHGADRDAWRRVSRNPLDPAQRKLGSVGRPRAARRASSTPPA